MLKIISKPESKKVAANPLETLWAEYWATKEKIKALQATQEELEEKILKECESQNLFKGQTATFGTNKVSYTDRPRLIVPSNFDFVDFADNFPMLVRADIDQTKVCNLLMGGDEHTKLNDYGFEIEIRRSYTFKKS